MPRGVYVRKIPNPKRIYPEYFWSRVNKTDGCWEWVGGNSTGGYGRIRFMGKQRLAHVVSMYLHTGEWAKKYVCHHCDNTICVRPEHLYFGSPKENTRDSIVRGRFYGRGNGLSGESVKTHKLKNSDVSEILSRYVPYKITQKQLAIEYGVDQVVIGRIVRGEAWKEVPRTECKKI